jgi:hypothetical protein
MGGNLQASVETRLCEVVYGAVRFVIVLDTDTNIKSAVRAGMGCLLAAIIC